MDNYTEEELTVMGHGALCLMACLSFQDEAEFLDAVKRGQAQLKKEFPAVPQREPTRKWLGQKRDDKSIYTRKDGERSTWR